MISRENSPSICSRLQSSTLKQTGIRKHHKNKVDTSSPSDFQERGNLNLLLLKRLREDRSLPSVAKAPSFEHELPNVNRLIRTNEVSPCTTTPSNPYRSLHIHISLITYQAIHIARSKQNNTYRMHQPIEVPDGIARKRAHSNPASL